MSTLATTNIKHPSSASNNIVLDSAGGVDLDALTVSGSAPADSVNIDASGRLLVGTSSARTNMFNTPSSYGATLQVEGTTYNSSSASIITNSTIANPVLFLARSKGATVGSNTIVSNGDCVGEVQFQANDGSEFVELAAIQAYVDGTPGANDMPGRLSFSTTADGASSPTERMRITSAGALKLSTSGSYRDATGTANEMLQSNNNNVLELRQTSATYANDMLQLRSVRNTTNNTYSAIGYFNETAGAYRFFVWDSGNVQNTNNSYGAISDIKLKENIVDATSQWDDIKTLQVRKYNFKQETGQSTHTQIGLVAQEVELVSPGLVSESPDRDAEGNDLGTVTKSVNYSVLYMKAVKALQEAMERIETLESEMVAVKVQLA